MTEDTTKVEKKSKRFSWKDYLFLSIFTFIALGVGLILLNLALKSEGIVLLTTAETITTLDEADPGVRFWSVESVTPIGNLYTVSLVSNAGNLKTFQDIASFGLSNDRTLIVVNSGNEIKIINLNSEQITLAKIPSQQYAGNVGESISWKSDNSKFAMGIYTDSKAENEKVWIFKVDGSFESEIDTNLVSEGGSISKVSYQPEGNLVMTKTYKISDSEDLKSDGASYLKSELPIYLTIYNENGELVDEIMARDFDTSQTDVFYKWDNNQDNLVDYLVYKKTDDVNPNQEFLFTKVLIGDE